MKSGHTMPTKAQFFNPIQSIIQDYGLRKRHYCMHFSVLYPMPFL